MTTSPDFRDYYNLESYLFDTVRPRFRKQGYLDAFDFFCIVIWKANRAKSKIARKLQRVAPNLDKAASVLTAGLGCQPGPEQRLSVLWQAGFDLPMASAILTVLYPEDFTVYDKRVCDQLNAFYNLKATISFAALWSGYQNFKRAVESAAPGSTSLRDKDRYLWGKSFHDQLRSDIQHGFKQVRRGWEAST